jgi:hypothetical protein
VTATRVELLHVEGRAQHWLRFGRPTREEILDRRRRAVWIGVGAVFSYIRWRSNDYGTVLSRIDILRAGRPGETIITVPGVRPGGVALLRLAGWPLVARALVAIDQVEALGVDPADACPDHWRHVHNRISGGASPRPYTAERHRAWLFRRDDFLC